MNMKFLSVLFVFIIINFKVIAGITDLNDPMNVHTGNASLTINATPSGLVFNNDGTKMFTTGSNSSDDEINEWDLTTAFDVSTASHVDRLPVGTGELGIDLVWDAEPFGLTFNGDGTKLFLMGAGGDDLHEITLGTAYDLSTYDTSTVVVWDISSLDARACGITFNNDGTKLFISGFTDSTIIEVPLSTAYSIAESSRGTPEEYSVFANDRLPRDVDFNSDGTKMYIISGHGKDLSEYTLDTAFDLSEGFTHKGSYDVSSEDSEPFQIEFNNDGTKMFMLGYDNSDSVHEYSLTTAFEINNTAPTLSSSSPSDGASSVGVNDNIVLTFSEVVDAESGNILIKKSSDDSTVETISVTDSNVSGSGSTEITINPDTTLDGETDYYITIASTAFDDVDSADYAGISSSTALNFTTETIASEASDPFEDKTVVALVEAQTKMPKRIVKNVSIPIFNRLQWMRNYNEDRELFSQGIKFKFSNPKIASIAKVVPAALSDDEEVEEKEIDTTWSFWSEGSVSVGKVGDTISSHSKDINTNGITIGLDNKVSDRYLYGYTVRYTNDDVDVGTPGTSLDTDGYSFSTYASLLTGENKFIEGIFGVSKLDLKNVRKSGSNILHGDRDGAQLYGSINYVTALNRNNLNISPNIRLDISQTHLKGYTETGTDALSYNDQTIKNGTLYSGINLNNVSKFNNINFVPNAGIELGLDFSPSSDVSITYVSDPNTSYMRSIDQQESKSGKVKLGFDIITQTGFSLSTLYERNQSENSHSDTFYLRTAYITLKETQYALSIQDNIASADYIKKLNGFDLVFDTVYDLFSEHPEYAINLKVSSIF